MEFQLRFSNPERRCCENAALSMAANLENSAVATGLENFYFNSNPKERNVKACLNYHTFALISHTSKYAQYSPSQASAAHELWTVQAGFRKSRGTRDQIANIRWIIKKAREFQKNIFFIDYGKAFDCLDHNKLWKILQEMGIPDHLTYLLRYLYAGQEATVRTRHGTMDWFQTGKGEHQGCILSPCLLT